MKGSGTDAVASNNKVSGGGSKGRFSRELKWSCQCAMAYIDLQIAVYHLWILAVLTQSVMQA